jgi:hypothetical protein
MVFPVEGIAKSVEQMTRVLCQTDVQEFHLWHCMKREVGEL